MALFRTLLISAVLLAGGASAQAESKTKKEPEILQYVLPATQYFVHIQLQEMYAGGLGRKVVEKFLGKQGTAVFATKIGIPFENIESISGFMLPEPTEGPLAAVRHTSGDADVAPVIVLKTVQQYDRKQLIRRMKTDSMDQSILFLTDTIIAIGNPSDLSRYMDLLKQQVREPSNSRIGRHLASKAQFLLRCKLSPSRREAVKEGLKSGSLPLFQTHVRGADLPSPRYLEHPPEYSPVPPEEKLPKEAIPAPKGWADSLQEKPIDIPAGIPAPPTTQPKKTDRVVASMWPMADVDSITLAVSFKEKCHIDLHMQTDHELKAGLAVQALKTVGSLLEMECEKIEKRTKSASAKQAEALREAVATSRVKTEKKSVIYQAQLPVGIELIQSFFGDSKPKTKR